VRTSNQGKWEELALRVAKGTSVRQAARQVRISETSAYKWHSQPEFQQRVAELRAQILDETVGTLTANLPKAASDLAKLSRAKGTSPKQKIDAIHELFTQAVSMRAFSDLEARLLKLERKGDDKPDAPA